MAAANQYTVTSWDEAEWQPAPLEDIPFYFGRTDCATSPNAEEYLSIPAAKSAWNATLEWFDEFFDFDEEDVVAIMGAHTLGRATHTASGYDGQWTQHPHVLNNEYYWSLSWETGGIQRAEFQQFPVNELVPSCIDNGTFNGGDNMQWIRTENDTEIEGEDGERFLMLNTDLALSLVMEPFLNTDSGEISCAAPTLSDTVGQIVCPRQIEEVWESVDEFARDNEEWLEEFAEVFEEMVTVHLDTDLLQELTVPYDRSFEVVLHPVTTEYGDGGDTVTDGPDEMDSTQSGNVETTVSEMESTASTESLESTQSTSSSTESEMESTSSTTESEGESTSSSTTSGSESTSSTQSTSSTEVQAAAIAMRHAIPMNSNVNGNTTKETALKYVFGPGIGAFFVTAMYVIYKRKKISILSAEVTKTLVNNPKVYGAIDGQDAF